MQKNNSNILHMILIYKRIVLVFLLAISLFPLMSCAQDSTKMDGEKLIDLYQSQRFAEATDYLRSIYTDSTVVEKEILQLAYSNMMAGNLTAAETFYSKINSLQPQNIFVLFNLANICHRRGNDAQAKIYYIKISKIDSTNFNVYKQLASIILSPTSIEKIQYLKKANSIQPRNADVAFDLSYSLNLINKNDSAYQVIDEALKADTSNIILLKAKMPICIALSKIDESIETGNLLLSMGDSSSYVLNNIGKAYYLKKDFQKAVDIFENLKKLQQQNEVTLYYSSLCYKELKHYDNAAKNMLLAIEAGISPYTSKYYKTLGEIYESDSMIEQAKKSYIKSLEFKNDGGVYYNLALLNDFKSIKKQLALKYYRLYLKTNPDQFKHKEVITYVKSRIALIERGQR
ncbi:Flp pilus assembly protein TadD, contains TPR repeats [Pedobacter westerhofensis]|uniref:Flp pilus assembly protein TadD, contains TPR repeats n=1 Tax=Pedobacter westerhofensis TaxID=425512 RepID=A0A521FST2_9SPHI|nr:hypothetical protein [Pedobacter westerhofensis]SMO99144.1 Flp pilus assembly protein TadD, contains TPR repeats [Pedobacter westerhofensis]